MANKQIYVGKLHVVKVPSQHSDFFPYSHFKDKYSGGPLLELYSCDDGNVIIRISGLAKLKPNIQNSPKLRVDIYGPHTTAGDIAQQLTKYIGGSENVHAETNDDPEAARKGPQTLPKIDKSYSIPISKIIGKCGGFEFSGGLKMYFDHERPQDDHIEMEGPEMHLGVPMDVCKGSRDLKLIVTHDVPSEELRVKGEKNPIEFAPFVIQITLSDKQARDFASTIQASYL